MSERTDVGEQTKPLDEHEPGCWCPEHLRMVGTSMRNIAEALGEAVAVSLAEVGRRPAQLGLIPDPENQQEQP